MVGNKMVTIILPPEEILPLPTEKKIIFSKNEKCVKLKKKSWDCVTWFYIFSPYLFLFAFAFFIENDWIRCNTLNWKHYIHPCHNDSMLDPEIVEEIIQKVDALHEKLININAIKQYDLPTEFNAFLTNLINETLIEIHKDEYQIDQQIRIIEKCVFKNVKENSCSIYAVFLGAFSLYFLGTILTEFFVHYYHKAQSKIIAGDGFESENWDEIKKAKRFTRTFTIPMNIIMFASSILMAYCFPFFELTQQDFFNKC